MSIVTILLVISIGLKSQANQEKLAEGTLPSTNSGFQGVWEQIGLTTEKGNLEQINRDEFDFLKILMITIGDKSYWVYSVFPGIEVTVHRLKVSDDSMPSEADFIDVDDNRTVRCRFQCKRDQLTLCLHGGRKTLTRPQKIEATADGFVVKTFKKLSGQEKKSAIEKDNQLMGLWETVGYEFDGTKLEDQEEKLEFRKNQKVYYFQKGIYTLVGTNGASLRVTHDSYEFNEKAGKNAIDLRDGDKVFPAIYKLDGDNLTLCWSFDGKTRPETFQTEKDDGRALIRLKRTHMAR
jgi:uncharacterized protein (TIGR03067 family)